ncbi:MAG: hypothetical protein RLZZ08_1146 [Pseudomonadota bacterium]|jgi:putative Ca2+/H+ antiporter (TMEM165/GDT1 family)
MDAFLTSTVLVALAEIGDKTQLLALVLAARFRRPVPVIMGILVATLANHGLAALLGASAAAWLQGPWFSFLVALSFIVMGLWTLIPDKLDEDAESKATGNAFLTTTVAFFIVEMGDKTQLATVALGARFDATLLVVAGTTLGMLLANAPVVVLGEKLLRVVPMKAVHIAAALLFIAIGGWMLASQGLPF